MTDERIITACVVTSGEQSDGKYLPALYEKTKETGVEVETIVGDAAYSGKDNIQLARKEKVHLVSKLNPSVSKGCYKEGAKSKTYSITIKSDDHLFNMELQAVTTIFVVNMKRIMTLINHK